MPVIGFLITEQHWLTESLLKQTNALSPFGTGRESRAEAGHDTGDSTIRAHVRRLGGIRNARPCGEFSRAAPTTCTGCNHLVGAQKERLGGLQANTLGGSRSLNHSATVFAFEKIAFIEGEIRHLACGDSRVQRVNETLELGRAARQSSQV